jgi:hypothetical protein
VNAVFGAEDPNLSRARTEFARGTELVSSARWAEALAAFEQSDQLRPHAITKFNIGACLRAMGRYTNARIALAEALERTRAHKELPAALVKEANAFLLEIDQLVVQVDTTIAPADARIAVDGHPLTLEDPSSTDPRPRVVAGVAPPGAGTRAPASSFVLILDPGPHVFLLSRKGFAAVAVRQSYPPGAKESLDLQLDRLPATLQVASNVPSAVVRVDGLDVGVAPVKLRRPAGEHQLEVRRDGYVTYRSEVLLRPGENVSMRAELARESQSLTSQWWFWTTAAVVVTGVAAGTYYATRPEPEPPPLNGGGLGWVVPIP